jgi:hypothetical protein
MELLVDVIVGFVLGYDVGPSFRGIAASGDDETGDIQDYE